MADKFFGWLQIVFTTIMLACVLTGIIGQICTRGITLHVAIYYIAMLTGTIYLGRLSAIELRHAYSKPKRNVQQTK